MKIRLITIIINLKKLNNKKKESKNVFLTKYKKILFLFLKQK